MRIEAYAKVNFSLEVFGVRVDGFHALRSIVLPISLCDTLEIDEAGEFSCDTGYPDDLCLKAARTICPDRPVAIRVIKRIPVGGGLGGGSADAAATLLALNEMRGLGLSLMRLAEIGSAVGSDVPALVLAHDGGAVMMEGRGELVGKIDVKLPSRHLVLANPGVSSSTKAVYAACTARTCQASERVNDLQEPAVRLYPAIAVAMKKLSDAGAENVMMSGSGATVYGFAPTADAAFNMAARLSSQGLWSVHASARI